MGNKLPYADGLIALFDATIADSVSASKWVNQQGGTNFVMQNATYADNTITLSGSNVAWLPIAQPTDYTAYILFRTSFADTGNSHWCEIFGTYGNWQCYIGVSMGGSKYAQLKTYNTTPTAVCLLDSWHVVTMTKTGGIYTVYYDGTKVITENNSSSNGDKFLIKSISGKGAKPTVDEKLDILMKYCAICTDIHSAGQISSNTNWILQHTGLMGDTTQGGINAAAMAYCMAYNKLASQMIEVQKKAYRKGLKDGHDGSTGTDTGRMPTEVITDVPVPSDGNIPLGDGGGNSGTGEVTAPAAFDFSGGGLYIKTASISITDDSGTVVTGVFQLHITLDLSYQETSNEGHTVSTGRLFLRLTGNGVDTSTYAYDYSGWRWKGYTNYGTAYNSYAHYPFEARLYTGGLYELVQVDFYNKSTGEVTSSETISLYWEFSGEYLTALRAGAYYGTVPFADVK